VLGDEPATDATTAIVRWLMLAAIVFPVSMLLATASYRWIEAPAIAAGRRLGDRIKRVAAS
jgi:peptidoglycan/LPS O-acetylase OafA/YrhL